MADSQNQYLKSSWWQDYAKMLQAAQPTNMQMQLLAAKPNTALGLSAGNFLGALLGHFLYPKRDGNMGTNEDNSNAYAYDYAVRQTDKNLQDYAANNSETALAQLINDQNKPNISDTTFGIDLNKIYPESSADKLREIQHNYQQHMGQPTLMSAMTKNELAEQIKNALGLVR